MLGDVRLLNEGIGPKPPHQVIFINQVTGVLDQHKQGFESLVSERHRFAVENQKALLRVEVKGTEGVKVPCFLAHKPRQKLFKISSQFRKDF